MSYLSFEPAGYTKMSTCSFKHLPGRPAPGGAEREGRLVRYDQQWEEDISIYVFILRGCVLIAVTERIQTQVVISRAKAVAACCLRRRAERMLEETSLSKVLLSFLF